MVALPPRPEQEIINRIYSAIAKEKADPELYLGRLGASSIGEECLRRTWLSWRAYASRQFEGRMYRLFETGHLQEERIVADLRRAGLPVWDKDPESGRQYEYTDTTGHLIVKLDGVVKGVPLSEEKPHVLEVKTHNKNSFSGLQKKGVQEAKPEHYMQVQTGLLLSGLERGLYVSVCKDDESYHVERVKADKTAQKQIAIKVDKLVNATIKPAGISDDGEGFGCKFCDMKEVCTGRAAPLRTCRSCVHADPVSVPGEWVCSVTRATLSKDTQRRTCDEYTPL
jgi:hypothetical protein